MGKEFERKVIAMFQGMIKSALKRLDEYEGTQYYERAYGEVQGLENALLGYINMISLNEKEKAREK